MKKLTLKEWKTRYPLVLKIKRRQKSSKCDFLVSCPICKKTRWVSYPSLYYWEKSKTPFGRCRKCMRPRKTMAQWSAEYPGIILIKIKYGRNIMTFLLLCPICNKRRWASRTLLVRQKKFKIKIGRCKCCFSKANRKVTLPAIKKEFPNLKITKYRKRNGTSTDYSILVYCPALIFGVVHNRPHWTSLSVLRKQRVVGACNGCSLRKSKTKTCKAGYVYITVDGETIAAHRLIMQKMLGRKLRKGETVHHKNGKRADNREINLELRMSGNHPKGWSLRQMREYLKTVPEHLGGLKIA